MEDGTLYNMEMWRVASRVLRPSSRYLVWGTYDHNNLKWLSRIQTYEMQQLTEYILRVLIMLVDHHA